MVYKKINIFCFDVDNTLIDGYTQKYFLIFLFNIGKINIFFLFISYIWFVFYKLHFTKKLYKPMSMLAGKLKGLNIDSFNILFDTFFDKYLYDKVFINMKNEIINQKKNHDNILVLLSTSFSPIVERVAKNLGCKYFIGTQIEMRNEICTGKISGPIIDGEDKVCALNDFLKKINLIRGDVNLYIYTDSHNDMSLLKYADYKIAVNPTKKLKGIAKKNNWQIINH